MFWTFVLSGLLWSSCKIQSSDRKPTVEAPVTPPDSTKYYDSLFLPKATELDGYFTKLHKKSRFHGSVLFADRGKVVFEKSYGFAKVRPKEELTTSHTFQLASASKPITATAILILAEQGRLNLKDPVYKYISPFNDSAITVEMLLTHRSGLSKYTHFCDNPDTVWPDHSKTIDNNDVIEIMDRIKPWPAASPGRRHYYSNTNYLLLASIVETVSGKPFEAYLKDEIFDPIGMSSTVVYSRDNKDELVQPVTGYTARYVEESDIYLNGCVGDKGVYSNCQDLLKFDRALFNNILLSKRMQDSATKPRNRRFRNGQNYGYGWRLLNTEKKGLLVFHTGWWKGFRSYFIRIPEHDQTVIVLTHVNKGKVLYIEELANLI